MRNQQNGSRRQQRQNQNSTDYNQFGPSGFAGGSTGSYDYDQPYSRDMNHSNSSQQSQGKQDYSMRDRNSRSDEYSNDWQGTDTNDWRGLDNRSGLWQGQDRGRGQYPTGQSSYGSREQSSNNYNQDYGQSQAYGAARSYNQSPSHGQFPSFNQSSGTGYGQSQDYGQSQGSTSSYGKSFRGVGPKGYKRSDERVTEDVNEELTHDMHIDASNIEVSVEDGVVTLSGTVDSRQIKRHAEDCVEQVRGVKDVVNNLKVQSSSDRDQDQDQEQDQDRSAKSSTSNTRSGSKKRASNH